MKNELECKLQSRCFTQLWNHYPEWRKRMAAVTNNSENAIKGALNKSMGVLQGVSDTFVLMPDGKVIWMEFKRPGGGYQSDAQKDWQGIAESLGHTYVIIDNDSDFWLTLGLDDPNIIPKLF